MFASPRSLVHTESRQRSYLEKGAETRTAVGRSAASGNSHPAWAAPPHPPGSHPFAYLWVCRLLPIRHQVAAESHRSLRGQPGGGGRRHPEQVWRMNAPGVGLVEVELEHTHLHLLSTPRVHHLAQQQLLPAVCGIWTRAQGQEVQAVGGRPGVREPRGRLAQHGIREGPQGRSLHRPS